MAWGAVDSCATMRAGDSRSVDLIVQGLPQAKDGSTAGIVGFSVTLNFDPAVVRATSTNGKMLLDTVTGANPASFSEPDVEPGRYIVSIADLGPTGEGGAAAIVARSDGVLARITFEGVGPGSTGIEMTNAGIIDEFNDAHAPAAIEGARLAVDAACQ